MLRPSFSSLSRTPLIALPLVCVLVTGAWAASSGVTGSAGAPVGVDCSTLASLSKAPVSAGGTGSLAAQLPGALSATGTGAAHVGSPAPDLTPLCAAGAGQLAVASATVDATTDQASGQVTGTANGAGAQASSGGAAASRQVGGVLADADASVSSAALLTGTPMPVRPAACGAYTTAVVPSNLAQASTRIHVGGATATPVIPASGSVATGAARVQVGDAADALASVLGNVPTRTQVEARLGAHMVAAR